MAGASGEPLQYSVGRYGFPHTLSVDQGSLSSPASAPPSQIARRFLSNWRSVFRLDAQDEDALQFVTESSIESLALVYFRQTVGGLPLYEGGLRVAVDDEGRVVWVASNSPAPSAALSGGSSFSAQQALDLAWKAVGVEPPPLVPAGTRRGRVRFEAPGYRAWAEQVAFPMSETQAAAAWRTHVITPEGGWEVVIGAADGRLLIRRDIAAHIGSGRVWRESPVAGSRELVEFGDGWLPENGEVSQGNNVDAFLDLDDDDVPDALSGDGLQAGRAFSESQVFDFPAGDGFGDPTEFSPAAITSAFYFANLAHDWFYDLGFREADGNFQQNNFGRGGEGGDRVEVHVQDGNTYRDAFFIPGPDGEPGSMSLGYIDDQDRSRDGAYDGPVVFHEYAHGVTVRLAGGPDDTACLSGPQGRALGEAWSDYFAASHFGNPVIGEYLSGNTERGFRRGRLDEIEFGFEDLGSPIFEPHNDGEIFAATLWDIREALGAERADQLILSAVKLTPCPATFIDARRAIILVDQNVNDSRDRETLWRIFAARGLGFSADAAEFTDAVLTLFTAAFDLPEDLQAGNNPPRVPSRPADSAVLGDVFRYQVRGVDPDGDPLTYTLLDAPPGASIDAQTGRLEWIGNFTGARFLVEVADGRGGRTAHGFFLTSFAVLTLGRPLPISGPSGSSGIAGFLVAEGVDVLQVTLRGGQGDPDLTVGGQVAEEVDGSFSIGPNETLTFVDPMPGVWLAIVAGATDYEGVRIEAESIRPQSIDLGAATSAFSGPETSQTLFEVDVPEGTERLRITTSGESGEPDLFVAHDRIAQCAFFTLRPCDVDQQSIEDGPFEVIDIESPATGKWSILALGFGSFTDLKISTATSSPLAQPDAAVDGAAFEATLTPLGISSLFGGVFSDGIIIADAVPLPTELAGIRVIVAGFPAPLYFVSPTQINFQVPLEILIDLLFGDEVSIFVERDGVLSDPITSSIGAYAPQVFTYQPTPGVVEPVIVHADGSLVTAAHPARAGEVLVVYVTGFGLVNDPPEDGEASTADPLSQARDTVFVSVGGGTAQVLFAGLTPGLVGLGQVNVQLPDPLPPGVTLALVIRVVSADGELEVLSKPVQLVVEP